MQVCYPLSLKVSLWLMLNLPPLAALGLRFFVGQGGLGWGAPPSASHFRRRMFLPARQPSNSRICLKRVRPTGRRTPFVNSAS